MVFVACGLNHKTAPIDVREKIALPESAQQALLHDLVGLDYVHEATILSTCNRMEVYCDTDEPQRIIPWLTHEYRQKSDSIEPCIYLHEGYHGIRHTLRVASGLDSMMLGEPQILGQMKQAYQTACQVGAIKSNLRHVFEYIFKASKRVRTRSGISKNPVSVAFAAVQLVRQCFELEGCQRVINVLILGSGETASLVAKYLLEHGSYRFIVASRTYEHAKRLADTFQGEAIVINELPQYLPQADLVISATTCPLPFITQTLVMHAMQQRQQAKMFFLDLAVPRDIEADVADLENVYLYNVDDLHTIVEQNMQTRQFAALQAEQLVDHELEKYIRWHRSLRAKHVICDYRHRMQQLAEQELQRTIQKLAAGQSQQIALAEFTTRLVNKLTHTPTIGLQQVAEDSREDLLELAHYLFRTTDYEKIT